MEIPLGLGLITLLLLLIAVVNLFTKPAATVSGMIFSGLLFIGFELSERSIIRKRGKTHVELDQFNLAQEAELTEDNVGVGPGNILVPVSSAHALYGLESAIHRAKKGKAEVVVLHVRVLQRAGSGESDLAPDQSLQFNRAASSSRRFSPLRRRKENRSRLAVAAANDLWESILRTASTLESCSIVLGSSSRVSTAQLAIEIGMAWERMPDPRPRVTLEIFAPGEQEQIFYLGPHTPSLTPTEIELLHKVWLDASDKLQGEEDSPPRHYSFCPGGSG